MPRTPAAGVRKRPMDEIAGRGTWRCRARYRELSAGHKAFQRLTRGKKSTLDNFRVMSLTTTFEPHRTNRCFEGLQEPRRCPTKLFRIVRQDDRHISHCKGLSFQSSACGCSPAGTGAILLVVW